MKTSPFNPTARTIVIALLPILVITSGCMRRSMMIRSNPPGARVFVDGYEIGATPVSHDFTYYGKRRIKLVKDGFQTVEVLQSISTPWYQLPPIDFITDNLIPGEIHDRRAFDFTMAPRRMVQPERLLERAEELRAQTRFGIPVAQAGAPSTATPNMYASPVIAATANQPLQSLRPHPGPIREPTEMGSRPHHPLPSRF